MQRYDTSVFEKKVVTRTTYLKSLPEWMFLLLEGRKIEAIKRLRAVSFTEGEPALGLKHAKMIVEDLALHIGHDHKERDYRE